MIFLFASVLLKAHSEYWDIQPEYNLERILKIFCDVAIFSIDPEIIASYSGLIGSKLTKISSISNNLNDDQSLLRENQEYLLSDNGDKEQVKVEVLGTWPDWICEPIIHRKDAIETNRTWVTFSRVETALGEGAQNQSFLVIKDRKIPILLKLSPNFIIVNATLQISTESEYSIIKGTSFYADPDFFEDYFICYSCNFLMNCISGDEIIISNENYVVTSIEASNLVKLDKGVNSYIPGKIEIKQKKGLNFTRVDFSIRESFIEINQAIEKDDLVIFLNSSDQYELVDPWMKGIQKVLHAGSGFVILEDYNMQKSWESLTMFWHSTFRYSGICPVELSFCEDCMLNSFMNKCTEITQDNFVLDLIIKKPANVTSAVFIEFYSDTILFRIRFGVFCYIFSYIDYSFEWFTLEDYLYGNISVYIYENELFIGNSDVFSTIFHIYSSPLMRLISKYSITGVGNIQIKYFNKAELPIQSYPIFDYIKESHNLLILDDLSITLNPGDPCLDGFYNSTAEFTCGPKTGLTTLSEQKKCEYRFTIESPLLCSNFMKEFSLLEPSLIFEPSDLDDEA